MDYCHRSGQHNVLTTTLCRIDFEQLSMITMKISEIGISVVLLVLESAPHDNKKQRTRRIMNPAVRY